MNNKYGIAPVGDPFEHLGIIKSVGFDATFTGWDHQYAEALAEHIAKLGLYYQSIHAPFSKTDKLWKEGEEGKVKLDELISCVNDCARVDVPIMVVHTFIGFEEHEPNEIGLSNFARLVDEAERLGVQLAFENVEGEEYLAAVMERFKDSNAVGFCFDSGHQLCYNANTDMLALYGDKLIHTHLNDNLGVFGDKITWHDDLHLPVGEGINDWKSVIQKIKATGYNDILMSELSLTNKPNHNELDRFIAMPIEEFYAFSLASLRKACEE
jgi:sugar phosphate isomerase/epimerase